MKCRLCHAASAATGIAARLDVAQALRRGSEPGLVDGDKVGVGAQGAERAHDPIADLEARRARAERFDDASQLDAEHRRQLQREGVADVAFTDLPVQGVDSRRPNADQHLSGAGDRLRGFGHLGGGLAAVVAKKNGAHGVHLSSWGERTIGCCKK